MSKAAHKREKLPENWWDHFVEHYQQWSYETLEEFCNDSPTISSKTLYRAKANGWMTARTLERVARKLDYPTQKELLTAWKISTSKGGQRLLSQNPKALIFTTKKEMPQWADYRDMNLDGSRLEVLACRIQTESPYFRFGFKLLNATGRLFGDGSIKSQDANLVVHVGRNNWSRRTLGVSDKDIFFTWYLNGISLEGDKRLFSSKRRLSASIKLSIDSSYIATFSVNGICCLKRLIPPGICRRVAMLAWGDREEYAVEVSEILVNPASDP
jgi:hypothetical protein